MKGRSNRGFVLLLVLVVILLASMVAASLLFVLRAEQTAAEAGGNGDQAWAAAMSGVYRALRAAADLEPDSLDWRENPELFQDQFVADDGVRKWYFSVYCPAGPEAVRFGLSDEASRIHLGRAQAAQLEALPGLTPTLAQSLLSAMSGNRGSSTNLDRAASSRWSAAASIPTEAGADDGAPGLSATGETTETAAAAAASSGGTLSCVDEALAVSGVSVAMLYGSAVQGTGASEERTLGETAGEVGTEAEGGLRDWLTVSSYDWNRDNAGGARLNLNDPAVDLQPLNLGSNTLAYLALLRTNRQTLAHPVELLEATFRSTNAQKVVVTNQTDLDKDQLAALLDRYTATNATQLPGSINLNTASATVLATLPGMSDTLAEAVVAAREGLSAEARKSTAWLYQEGLLNADTFKKVAPLLTTRSYQFRFQVAAYAVPEGPVRVLEAVVDTAASPPAILWVRDVSRQGMLRALRTAAEAAGQPLGPATEGAEARGKADGGSAAGRSNRLWAAVRGNERRGGR